MPTAIHRKIKMCEADELPSRIIRLKSGWVVAGDTQPLQGYCLLLAEPVVADLNQLDERARSQYALDMARVGDALLKVRGAYRINYETWGNQDPALHTHIVPRFMSESPVLRVQTPRQAYDWANGRPFSPDLDREWVNGVREFLKSFA